MSAVAPALKSLLPELLSARAESDRLFDIIRREAIYERPIDARHRVIFYLGHLDGFDSIQICREALGVESSDAPFDALFQAGIDPDNSHLPTDKPSDWPSLNEVSAYVKRCRAHVDKHLDDAPQDVICMALEHRLMHLETLAYMFHNFSYELKSGASEPVALSTSALQEWRSVPAGDAVLGEAKDQEFGWDNEGSRHVVTVEAFRMQRYPVTNGEYLDFVKAGAAIPNFWTHREGKFFLRGMFEEVPLPVDWPVYVSQQEAESYARFRGRTLPSEAQFHRAAYGTPDGNVRAFPWGNAQPSRVFGNFDFHRWDPEPVRATAQGDSAFGISQLVGNGWEWTNTVFAPFPGFQPRATYPGYSSNFFDGEHFVLKGGSPRTASRLLRSSFRNWFRRDYPYMYAKFRCIESE